MSKKKLVVLTGAGISAESGLRTFRDSDGLWEGYAVETVATPEAWYRDPELVLDFYNQRRRDVRAAAPNAAHIGLAALENHFEVVVITQNIDDLHERAGSATIIHLHGEIFKMRSTADPMLQYPVTADMQLGQRATDGAQLRPHIVWFGEEVPMLEPAIDAVAGADLIAIIGTSLLVYPAAGLINYAPPHIPKFLIDKKIPEAASAHALTCLEMPATAGIRQLQDILLAQYL